MPKSTSGARDRTGHGKPMTLPDREQLDHIHFPSETRTIGPFCRGQDVLRSSFLQKGAVVAVVDNRLSLAIVSQPAHETECEQG